MGVLQFIKSVLHSILNIIAYAILTLIIVFIAGFFVGSLNRYKQIPK